MSYDGLPRVRGGYPVMIDAELDPIALIDAKDIGLPCGEETVPIEVTRPIFDRDNFTLVGPINNTYICPTHNIIHEWYTHGCQPVAMAKSQWNQDFIEGLPQFRFSEVTLDAVPYPVTHNCQIHRSEPHIHQDFRWLE